MAVLLDIWIGGNIDKVYKHIDASDPFENLTDSTFGINQHYIRIRTVFVNSSQILA